MPCFATEPSDVLVFLLDDARFDQVAHLTETMARLGPEAITFERAYVTTPLCCPERASFLSGGWYAHQTGVLTNESPTGGATRFLDTRTMPVRLQEVGYHTALLGKYFNGYDELGLYVPPGWSTWAATGDEGGWRNFDVLVGSTGPDAAGTATTERVTGYVTDWHGERAIQVLSEAEESPLFLYVSFLAPHHPHVPAEADVDTFPDFLYRDRAYEEADVSDKPGWIRGQPLLTDEGREEADTNNRERLQTLLSVDRAIARVIDTVRASSRGDRTMFIVTSDNGQMWSEHRLSGKGVAYEEAVRIPLVIAHPDIEPRSTSALVAANLDLAATVQALAGLAPEGEGRSLLPVLCDGVDSFRDSVLVQGWILDDPSWSGLVTESEKYIETVGGGREFYDLVADPFEEESLHDDPASADRMDTLAEELAGVRGLVVSSPAVPRGAVGSAYSTTLKHWGGEDPVTWARTNGEIPPGIEFHPDGRISGTPTATGSWTFAVRVTDSGISPYTGEPQSWEETFTLDVDPGIVDDEKEDSDERRCGCHSGGALAIVLLGWARRRKSQTENTLTGVQSRDT